MSTIALLGIPFDAESSYRQGTAKAPDAIRAELARARDYSNMTSETGVDLNRPGLLTDVGNVACGTPAETRTAIGSTVTRLLDEGHRLLTLGGDHSVTYPILKAIHSRLGQVDVLHIDAHPDLYQEFEGNRFSHACPFARCLEEALLGRLVQVGIRTLNAPQKAQAEWYGVEMITMADWDGPRTLEFDRPVYISLDLDGLDPAFAPGVAHPEPGGLSVRDVIALIQRVEGRVIGADLVEYNPEADASQRTAPVCVKLLKELVGRISA